MIERFEESFQIAAVSQYSINKPAASGHYLTGYLNKAHRIIFKFS
jgi:hypothetical protein